MAINHRKIMAVASAVSLFALNTCAVYANDANTLELPHSNNSALEKSAEGQGYGNSQISDKDVNLALNTHTEKYLNRQLVDTLDGEQGGLIVLGPVTSFDNPDDDC